MELIDRKFVIVATCREHGHEHSEADAVLFLAKDKFLPELLAHYYVLCVYGGAAPRQLNGIDLLRHRVERWQREHPDLVKVPDVDPTPAGDAVVAPNEVA